MERISRLGEARAIAAGEDRIWNFWALVALVVTGASGRGGELLPEPTRQSWLRASCRMISCARSPARRRLPSALSLYVGRQALAVGAESGWLRARATAEAIKSECFRFAAGVGDYAPDKASDADAANAFIERRKAIAARAAGDSLTPEDDPVGAAGDEQPPVATDDRQMVSLEAASTSRSSFISRARRRTSAPISGCSCGALSPAR